MKSRATVWLALVSGAMLIAVALTMFWPWLLHHAVTSLLATQGWQLVSLQQARIGLDGLAVGSLKLRRAAATGEAETAIEMHDVQASFSWQGQRLSLLQASRFLVHWRQGEGVVAQAWPELPRLTLPMDRFQVAQFELTADFASGKGWTLASPLQLAQQGEGLYQLDFVLDGMPASARLQAGETSSLDLHWQPGRDTSISYIYVTYAKSSLHVESKIELKNNVQLVQQLLTDQRIAGGSGLLLLEADMELGQHVGEWESIDVRLQASELQLTSAAKAGARLALDGRASFSASQPKNEPHWSARLEPGLKLSINSVTGNKPWQLASQIRQTFAFSENESRGSIELLLNLADVDPIRFSVDKLRLQKLLDPEQFSASGNLRLKTVRIKPDWPELGADASWQWHAGRLDANGRLLSRQQKQLLAWRGDYAEASGCMDFELEQVGQLGEFSNFISSLYPALTKLQFHDGNSSARFSGSYCPGDNSSELPRLTGRLDIQDGKLGWEKSQATGIDISLRLHELQGPRASLFSQADRIELGTGLVLSPVRLKLETEQGSLKLEELGIGLLDGFLEAGPVQLPLPPRSGAIALNVRGIDLGRLLALLDQPGLEGAGRLSGILPLTWSQGKAEIRDGHLQSTMPGRLRYQPPTPVTDNIGLQALRDFHYGRLDLGLNYLADGQYRLELRLDGHNPDLYSAHPIAFKLNIDGKLPGLLQGALLSGDFDSYLLKQIQQDNLE